MKAYVLHGINDLQYETVPDPVPGENEVLVAVRNVGICGSDIPRIYRTGTYSYPLIPGHEFAGEVVDTGKSVDKSWIGKRVGVFPLIPCRGCEPCRKKHYELCRNYSYLGSRKDGGFAELAAVPVWNLLQLPEEVSFAEAAMLEPMSVAVHAMRRGLPQSGGMVQNPRSQAKTDGQAVFGGQMPETGKVVAVCGLGTIGLFLLMFLKEAGWNQVLAFGNKEFQKEKAMSFGVSAQDYCDIKSTDAKKWLMEQTDGRGVDVFFECVGKNETVSLAVDVTAPEGRIVMVGNPASDMLLERNVYWKILRSQLMVTGTWNSTFQHQGADDWHYVLSRLSEKRIDPSAMISHRFPLDSLEQGLHIMRDKTEDYGKIMAESGTGSYGR